jgi:hypothetical protein
MNFMVALTSSMIELVKKQNIVAPLTVGPEFVLNLVIERLVKVFTYGF